jgi:hypothetical protein
LAIKTAYIHRRKLIIYKENTHLFINLNTIVSDFFELDKNEPLNRAFGIISSAEDEILTALRDHKVEEILIKKSHNKTITYTLTQNKNCVTKK